MQGPKNYEIPSKAKSHIVLGIFVVIFTKLILKPRVQNRAASKRDRDGMGKEYSGSPKNMGMLLDVQNKW